LATNNGNNNGNNFDDLFSDAFNEATAEPVKSKGSGARLNHEIIPSAWFLSLSERDQAILRLAGWVDAEATMAVPARYVTADRPTLPQPSQRPSKEGKVRNASLYDPATLARLREEARASEVARFNLCCSVAATLARTNKPIAIVDLAALTVAVGLRDEIKAILALVSGRLNLPCEVKGGKLTALATVPDAIPHGKYAAAFNKAVAKVRAQVTAEAV
jgi:hypothetical protein